MRRNSFRFINPFRNMYLRRREDEEIKQTTIIFGLLAILFSVLCVALCYPCVWVGVKGIIYAFTHFFGPLTYLFGIANLLIASLALAFMLIPYYFWLQGIQLVVMQLCLNRRLISWLALIIWLASVVGIFLFSLESFLVITGMGHVFQ